MSFSTLGIGASALTAAQRAVETAAHNIANSTVEGYTRQRLNITSAQPTPGTDGMRGSGMRGNGVTIVSIDRLRGELTDVAVRSEEGSAGSAGARAAVLDRAQGILGPYGSGLPESLSKLWTSFTQLGISPNLTAAREGALVTAGQVADGFRDAAAELEQIRTDAFVGLRATVGGVNADAKEISDLNRQIADALVGGQAPNDLLDRRDLALDRLAASTGATSRTRPDGMVDVTIDGEVLVRGITATKVVLGTTAPPSGIGADPVLSIDGRTIQSGGQLGGTATALVQDLRQFEADLDTLARTVSKAVNDQHAKGFDAAGEAGGAVFVLASARDMVVNPELKAADLAASATQEAGGTPENGENATEMAKLRNGVAGQESLTDLVNGFAAALGSRAAGALRAADATEAGLAGVREQRDARNGVSIDEEMVDLVRFQHGYDAAARVISIADGMLDTLINRMGAGR